MGRGRSSSWPPAAAAVLLLLFLFCFSHGVAAARLLPLQPAAVVVPPQVLHQEMMGADVAAASCDCEGDNDGCLERRLLADAHLDYIYTQHKGKP